MVTHNMHPRTIEYNGGRGQLFKRKQYLNNINIKTAQRTGKTDFF